MRDYPHNAKEHFMNNIFQTLVYQREKKKDTVLATARRPGAREARCW